MLYPIKRLIPVIEQPIFILNRSTHEVTPLGSDILAPPQKIIEHLNKINTIQPFTIELFEYVACGVIDLVKPNLYYIILCNKALYDSRKLTHSILLLDYLINHRELVEEDILIFAKYQVKAETLRESMASSLYENLETETYHNPYDQELRELASIRQGDLDLLKESISESYAGKVGVLAKNQLRNSKNVAICLIALASRAAIQGGIHPEIAFNFVDQFCISLEEMTEISSINLFVRQVEMELTRMVAETKIPQDQHPLIYKAKKEIQNNLHKKIIVKDLAAKLEVSPEYLSTVFKKNEERTIKQYIFEEKIRYSEKLLRYSEHSIGEIASILDFSDQSHFTHIFKKIQGMSPKQYRNLYAKKDE